MLKPYRESGGKFLMAIVDYDDVEIRPERRIFDIETYSEFRTSLGYWDRIGPVNEFLSTLDRDEYSYLVKLFVRAKRDLLQIKDTKSMFVAIEAIDEKVAKVFGKLNLSERIHQYVANNKRIVIPDLSEAGSRPQDTEEMTFREPEYIKINAIIVIAKLLFPIFGEIISAIKYIDHTDNRVKEIIAFGIMRSLLERDFHDVIIKLQNYISSLVGSAMTDDPMLVFYGLTETGLTYDRLAKMIVKNSVNFDLYQRDGNVIRYIAVTIKRSIKTEPGTSRRVTYKSRMSTETADDGSNVSSMENAAHGLREPIEVPIVVKLGVDKFIHDYISLNNIQPDLFNKAVEFYKVTTVPPSPLNEFLISMFISDAIGSAYAVKYMNMEMITKVITLIQIYAMRMGFGEIVPLLTMVPSGLVKTQTDDVDNHIILSDGRGTSGGNFYVYIREMNSHLDDFQYFNLTDYLKSLVLYVVTSVHNYNVAPGIEMLGTMGESVNNNGVFKYGKNVMAEFYRFIYQMMTTDPERRITV